MRPEMSYAKSLKLATKWYGDARWLGGPRLLNHAEDVARLASRLLEDHYHESQGGFLRPTLREAVEDVQHAGLFFASVSCGGQDFESLVEAANLQVAQFVTAASRDGRLPMPQRDLEFRSRVAHSEIPAQVLALAMSLCDVRALASRVQVANELEMQQMQFALQRLEGDLGAMHRMADSPVLRKRMRYLSDELVDIAKRIGDRGLTKRLQAKIEARKAEEARNGTGECSDLAEVA